MDTDVLTLTNAVETLEAGIQTYATRRDKITADRRLTEEARANDLQALDDHVHETLVPRLDEVRTAIAAGSQDALDSISDLQEASIPQPAGAEDWQEAAARAAFVDADVAAAGTPAEIIKLLRAAVRKQDRIGVYLIVRAIRGRSIDDPVVSALRPVLDELYPIDEKKRARLERRVNTLNELYNRLPLMIGKNQERELMRRFNLSR